MVEYYQKTQILTDRGDCVQIRTVAAKKLSRTADSGWFFGLGIWREFGNPLPKGNGLLRIATQGLGHGRFHWNVLRNGGNGLGTWNLGNERKDNIKVVLR
jgi:hypothetical protein